MVGVFKYGERKVGSVDGLITIGDINLSSFPFSKLTIESSSDLDKPKELGASQVLVSGIGSDGKRVSEFVGLRGTTKVVTKNDFTFLDRIVINSGNSNIGSISVKTNTGMVVGVMPSGANIMQRAAFYATSASRILSFGVSTKVYAKSEPLIARLRVSSSERKTTIHTVFVDTANSQSFEKVFLAQPEVFPGDIVEIYCETNGSAVSVSAWMELEVV